MARNRSNSVGQTPRATLPQARNERKLKCAIGLRRLLRMELLEDRRLLTLDTVPWLSVGPDAIIDSQNVDTIAPPVPGGTAFNHAVSGAINVAAPRPNDPNTIFVGAVNGGIWKTTNAPKELWNGNPGPTWVNLTPNQPSLSITDLEFDPSSLGTAGSERLVAGVGTNSSFQGSGGALIGLLFSSNGGASWQVENGNGALSGRQISAVAPLGSEVLVAMNDAAAVNGPGIARVTLNGTNTNPFIQPTQFSIGGGLTLTRTGRVVDIIRDPLNTQTLFVALPEASRVAAGVTTQEGGIFRSLDGGQAWSRISTPTVNALLGGRAADGTSGPIFTNRVLLSLHHTNVLGVDQNQLYVGIVNSKAIAGLFRFDGNVAAVNAWRQLQILPTVSEGKHGDLHFSLVAHPTNPSVVFEGGDVDKVTNKANIVRVTFGATQATDRSERITSATSAPHPDSRGMAFDAAGNLIEVDDGGVYLFDSPSALVLSSGNWLSLNRNLSTFETTSVAFDPVNLGIVVGTQDNGTAFSSRGTTFTQILSGDGVAVKVDQVSKNVSEVYYSAQFLAPLIRRTENAGGPQGPIDLGPQTVGLQILDGNNIAGQTRLTLQVTDPKKQGFDPSLQFIPPIAINSVRHGNLFVGSKFLYESTNRGDTFRVVGGVEAATSDAIDNDSDGTIDEIGEVRPKTPLEGKGDNSANITAIAAGGFMGGVANESLLYVGFGSGDVFLRTTSGGIIARTATSLASLNGNQPVVDIKIDPRNGRTVYVATAVQVFRTDNDGQNWTKVYDAFVDDKGIVSSIELVKLPLVTSTSPTQALDQLFIGTNLGVFSTAIADRHNPAAAIPPVWKPVGTGLPAIRIQDLQFDEASDQMLAATLGRGVFKLSGIRAEFNLQRMQTGEVKFVRLSTGE